MATSELKKIYKRFNKKYLVTGEYAAFLYHKYQYPAHNEIRVFKEDMKFWGNYDFEIIPDLTERESLVMPLE
ncbi:MAG: hypothetical protein A7316_10440 [Candidatus Altiarchaeales archaeon WOR_SM1_86-2]|nr:MAG: hypothetical protein A7316_10440 [Candidatus Altiarchaeales archaeon WOR_SM1_86-2]